MSARASATSFPLPREDLFQRPQSDASMRKSGQQASLPRTGADLANVVSVLIKTAEDDEIEKSLAV